MTKKSKKGITNSNVNELVEQKEIVGEFRPSVVRLKQITDASAKFLLNATEEQLTDFEDQTEFKK